MAYQNLQRDGHCDKIDVARGGDFLLGIASQTSEYRGVQRVGFSFPCEHIPRLGSMRFVVVCFIAGALHIVTVMAWLRFDLLVMPQSL